MDAVTQTLLKEFIKSQQIDSADTAVQFEHFINYIVIADLYPEEFDVERIATGAGEFGLDGILVIANDTIVEDEEQLDDIAQNASSLTVQFVFTQAKTSASFDTGDFSKFLIAVADFFNPQISLVQNERVITAHRVKERLYEYAGKFLRGLPHLDLYYATTGTWKNDQNLIAIRDAHLSPLRDKHIFSRVDLTPLDAARIQKLYFQTRNSFKTSVNFPLSVPLPAIQGVQKAYIGLLSVQHYLNMISDEHGGVRRKLFFDNIRDFQAETEVNQSIAATIQSDRRIEFPLRNNGVTIVTRKCQRIGNDFHLEDFQVVNRCQTSHVLAANWSENHADFMIPAKIVCTNDDEINRNVIIASNQQNKVDQDSFWALDPIHKQIEIFFEAKSDEERLFYERRPGQYNSASNIEKVRIVTKEGLLKIYASVFLEEPNRVGRYYKDLLPLVGKEIFNSSHSLYPYYTAAFMAFRLEWLFRNRRLSANYKPFRFQLCMAGRLILEKELGLDAGKRQSKQYCEKIDVAIADIDKAQQVFEHAILAVDAAVTHISGHLDRRTAKMRDMRDALRVAVMTQSQTQLVTTSVP